VTLSVIFVHFNSYLACLSVLHSQSVLCGFGKSKKYPFVYICTINSVRTVLDPVLFQYH